MSKLPLQARLYVCAVITAGSALLYLVTSAAFAHPYWFSTLLMLSCLASAFKIALPLAKNGSTISLSSATDFFALIFLGPHEAMIIAGASAWAQCGVNVKTPPPIHRTLFSMASLVITVQAAGFVFSALGGTPGQLGLSSGGATALLGAALTYFLVNTALVALAIGLSTREPVLNVWHDNFLWSAPSYFAGALVAAGSQWAYESSGLWLALLAFPALYLLYRACRLYLGGVDAERIRTQAFVDLHLATVEALARAIDAKDQSDGAHLPRVQQLAARLAETLGMSEDEIQGVKVAALLHDVGKVAVPENILSKPGPLTHEEFEKVRLHPQIGAEIIRRVPFPYPVAPFIMSHHERWDGKGYPQGLKGGEIPLGARVLAVVDHFDALTSDRPYHQAMSQESALALLQQDAGKALDPTVVEAFVALLTKLPHAVRARSVESNDVFERIAEGHREIYALYEVAQTMGTSLGVSDTMALISSKLGSAVPFDACALFLQEEHDEHLRCRFATGVEADMLGAMTVYAGQGLTGWVARHRRPMLNARPSADFEAAGVTSRPTALQSALLMPLVFNERFIGVLAVYHTAADVYTDDHRRLLNRVCDQAAAVIHNAIVFEQTREDSLTDALTELPNTRFMLVHLTRELARAERLGSEVAMLVVDLDNFKNINDTYGHDIGDRALRVVANALRTAIRPYDVCVRYAGDEFIVVLSGCGQEEAEHKRVELQHVIDQVSVESRSGARVSLEASVGAAVYPHDGRTYETLLASADSRMYRDKALRKRQSGVRAAATGTDGRRPVLLIAPKDPGKSDSSRTGIAKR